MPITILPARGRRPGPLRGRTHEIDLATASLRDAATRGVGRAVLITGAAGTGKTAVLTQVVQRSRRQGFRVLQGQCDPVTPGASIVTALRSGPEPLVTPAVSEHLIRCLGSPGTLAEAVVAELARAAAERPVLVALDDAERSDPVSVAVLRALAAELAGMPLVLAVAGTDPGLDEEAPTAVRLPLGPLPPPDVTALAADRLGHEPDAPQRRLLALADGNPRLVVRIADSLRAGDGREVMAAVVRQRLAGLDAAAAVVVELVAVAEPIRLVDATALLDSRSGRSAAAIERAEASRLLTRENDTLGIRHDVIRDVICHSIVDGRRAELHGRLARQLLAGALPAAGVARHVRAAVRPGDDDAVPLVAAAAERLVPVDVQEAGDLAEFGLRSMAGDHPQWWDTGYRLLGVLVRAERPRPALELARLLAARTDDRGLAGQVEIKAAEALVLAGQFGAMTERVDRFLTGPPPGPAVEAGLLAVQSLAPAMTRPTPPGDGPGLGLRARALAAEAAGRPAVALDLCRRSRPVDSAPAWPEEISALRSLDRHAEADVLLRRTPALPPSLRYARAQLDLDAWHLIEAEEQARELVDLGLRSGPTTHTRDAALLLAAVALIRGEASTAAHLLRRTADAPETEEVVTLRGWLALLIGDLPAARIAGRTLLALAETGARWSWRPEWVTLLAEIGGNAGDPGLVELAAVRAAEGARRVPGTVTWAGLARYLRGQVDQDLTMIADGVALLREGPRALLRSWAADGYGHALLAAGDRRRAIGQLDTAWEEYHQAGARAGRSRVQRAMREAGVRSKKWRTATERQATGWSALSEAERRVAALIAAGSTNKMAAAELGISINTVGTHLRSVYAKMAVQSRVQLANLLRDHLPA